MATIVEMVEALDTYIESASGLNIDCIKGYPDFLRPEITTPISALFYAGSGEAIEIRKRVGASSKVVALTLAIYATDEINLLTLVQSLHAMRNIKPINLTADGDNIKLYFGEDERTPPDDGDVKEIRHLVMCTAVMVYE